MEMFRFREVEAILPVVLKVHDLDQEAVREDSVAELRKDTNFRLELPCQNGTKAFEHVQTAARTLNLGLLIEKRAQDRLKMPTMEDELCRLYGESHAGRTGSVRPADRRGGQEDRGPQAGRMLSSIAWC